MKYYVTIQVEEQIECDVCNAAEAIKYALQFFDASAHDPEIIEVWSEDEQ
jgi:hypothetical protein